jgi:CheY-like chemotaxis protein
LVTKINKRILVVDDDAETRAILKTYFEADGFDVSEAEDGYDAVQRALDVRPDLVVMDMAMPLVDGVNSTRAMRAHDDLRAIPIIALTGFGSFYRPRALAAGCSAVLVKPIDFQALAPVIAKHLGH